MLLLIRKNTRQLIATARYMGWIARLLAILTLHSAAEAQPPQAAPAVIPPNNPTFAGQVQACAGGAELHDLAVLSEDRLIAVGDRGLILASDSGGRRWSPVPSPTIDSLYAVAFSPTGQGVIVGGRIGSYTGMSRSVVLRSSDAGRTWTQTASDTLPRLTGAAYDGGRLLGWGDFSPGANSSFFESLDNGLSWQAVPVPLGHISAADSKAGGVFAAVDQLGNAVLRLGQTQPKPIADFDHPIHAMTHTGNRWLACGSDGELISSLDGNIWNDLPLSLSPEARQLCSWNCISQFGPKIWIGGSPGSVLLHSPDAGATWEVHKTGQTLPIKKMRFLDAGRGWAICALGGVLATRDGGDTWYAQRTSAQRLGVLGVADAASNVPWQPLVAAAWNEQVAVSSLVTSRCEPIEHADFLPSQDARLKSLTPNLGIAQYHHWNALPPSDAALQKRLAIELLTWRPDVVLTSETPESNNLASHAVAALRIAQRAGQDPAATELGLPAWQVKKLAAVTEPRWEQYSENAQRVLRLPGTAIEDLLSPLPIHMQLAMEPTAMRTVWAESQSPAAMTSLLGAIAPSAATQQELPIQGIGNYQLVMGRVHRQRILQRLARREPQNHSLTPWSGQQPSDEHWVENLQTAMVSMPASEIAPAIYRLAGQLSKPVDWPRRERALMQLIAMQPNSDAADWARIELLQCSASDEFRAWLASESGAEAEEPDLNTAPVQTASATDSGETSLAATSASVWNSSPFGALPDGSAAPSIEGALVVSASAKQAVTRQGTPASGRPGSPLQALCQSPLDDWIPWMQRLTRDSAALRLRPDVNFLIHSISRARAIGTSGIGAQLQPIADSRSLIGWPQMAQQESLMAAGDPQGHKWLSTASRATATPILDGVLQEDCWKTLKPMQLAAIGAALPKAGPNPQSTTIAWAYDDDYVYFAIQCQRPQLKQEATVQTSRQYDSDLSQLDRIELMIDTDRDYNTAINLAVAEDGRTFDRCGDLAEYNPRWYVAVQADAATWTAEVAIERQALTTRPITAGKAWAVTARRIGPGITPESWSQLRTNLPLKQSAGLLLFTDAENPTQP